MEFAPAKPVALRLDPDPEPRTCNVGSWRRKIDLPPCRLVWVGDVLPAPEESPSWRVEALVAPSTSTPDAPELHVVTMPISTLPLLTVGRVLKEKPSRERPSDGFGGPGSELRFLGSEWDVELSFGSPQTSIVAADALGVDVTPLPPHFAGSPLCVHSDPSSGKLVLVPCWEIFRYYYAQASAAAGLVFEFPRWNEEALAELLRHFDGHRFQSGLAWPNLASFSAETQLRAIGRDAAVSYARCRRIEIRAVPPFAGPAALEVVGIPTLVGDREALFVQQILDSRPRPERQRGTRWWPQPVPPVFRSAVEHAAWWGTYVDGNLRDAIAPTPPSWEAFVELVERVPGLLRVRHEGGPVALRGAYFRALASKTPL